MIAKSSMKIMNTHITFLQ